MLTEWETGEMAERVNMGQKTLGRVKWIWWLDEKLTGDKGTEYAKLRQEVIIQQTHDAMYEEKVKYDDMWYDSI